MEEKEKRSRIKEFVIKSFNVINSLRFIVFIVIFTLGIVGGMAYLNTFIERNKDIEILRLQLLLQEFKDKKEKSIDYQKAMFEERIRTIVENGVLIVYNGNENPETSVRKRNALTHTKAISKWAKTKGYDAVVIGRLQPDGKGDMMFTSYSGDNPAPIEMLINKLKDKKAKKVVSLMRNKTGYWLPAPFIEQVDGDLIIEKDEAFKVAGFGFSKDKIIFKSENFDASVSIDTDSDEPIEGGFKEEDI